MSNEPVFITTDGFPVYIGDRYHVIKPDGIAHWICDEDDEIPTGDTYHDFLTARKVKLTSNENT